MEASVRGDAVGLGPGAEAASRRERSAQEARGRAQPGQGDPAGSSTKKDGPARAEEISGGLRLRPPPDLRTTGVPPPSTDAEHEAVHRLP